MIGNYDDYKNDDDDDECRCNWPGAWINIWQVSLKGSPHSRSQKSYYCFFIPPFSNFLSFSFWWYCTILHFDVDHTKKGKEKLTNPHILGNQHQYDISCFAFFTLTNKTQENLAYAEKSTSRWYCTLCTFTLINNS